MKEKKINVAGMEAVFFSDTDYRQMLFQVTPDVQLSLSSNKDMNLDSETIAYILHTKEVIEAEEQRAHAINLLAIANAKVCTIYSSIEKNGVRYKSSITIDNE